jgi:hypothetical protein
MFNNLFFRNLCRLCDNVEEYSTAGQATVDNMEHTHCTLDNTHTEYVILISVSLPQRLNLRTAVLCYTHIAGLIMLL